VGARDCARHARVPRHSATAPQGTQDVHPNRPHTALRLCRSEPVGWPIGSTIAAVARWGWRLPVIGASRGRCGVAGNPCVPRAVTRPHSPRREIARVQIAIGWANYQRSRGQRRGVSTVRHGSPRSVGPVGHRCSAASRPHRAGQRATTQRPTPRARTHEQAERRTDEEPRPRPGQRERERRHKKPARR
jgi:hypothetical protein